MLCAPPQPGIRASSRRKAGSESLTRQAAFFPYLIFPAGASPPPYSLCVPFAHCARVVEGADPYRDGARFVHGIRVVEGADPYRDGARFAHGAYMDPDTGHKKAHCRSDAPFVFKFSVYTSFSAYTSLRRVAMSSAALAMKSETVISTVLSSLPRTETWPEATSLSPTMSM